MEEKAKWDDRIKYETEECPACHSILTEKEVYDEKASAMVLKRFCPTCGVYKTFQ